MPQVHEDAAAQAVADAAAAAAQAAQAAADAAAAAPQPQRQPQQPSTSSQNLVRIVTTIYGVGVGGALAIGGTKSAPIFHPLEHWTDSLIVLASAVFLVYGAFSYVLSLSQGEWEYKFGEGNSYETKRVWSYARFLSDLILAALYVRVLLIAVFDQEQTPPSENVSVLLIGMAWVFGWIVLVRILRYGLPLNRTAARNLPSVMAVAGLAVTAVLGNRWSDTVTRPGYFSAFFFVGVIVYVIATDLLAMLGRNLAGDA
jgi:drug/metabolite transporter (DMT)-like permease